MMIKSKKVVVIFVALSSFLLAGCDSPKDANKQNFEKAINTRLEKECITISPLGIFDSKPYPVQVAVAQANRYTSQERADEINSRQFSALDVLVKADLLTVKNTLVDDVIGFTKTGKKVPGREYALTDEGKKYLKSPERPDFCVGHYKVDEIVDFTEPGDAMGMKITQVNYTFSPTSIAEWAKRDDVRAAFLGLESDLKEKQTKRITLVLKNDGWSAER
ncbi:hypothetical protein ABZO83_004256 [Escherichia coli]|uniref:hypothetical protein n=1 Tax=Escherichia albertii TaxID=208962 RepID=UPI001076F9BB|nr:hypothetical protein [Escherichia albertii]EHJ6332938.1 hypothetical protein [Escherichia coli]EIG2642751.1 hypothetical protein [Shigella sonnei]ELW2753870.1 hypothetical protein [Escherichia coli O26]EKM3057209.1 hypothetical protein [Escherichia coli]EKR5459001.1 hypothetical protein [Escherichia coli]